MRQLSFALSTLGLVALLACGGEESTTADSPPVDAGPPATGSAAPSGTPQAAAEPAAMSPEAEGCLALVRDRRYREAVPPCTQALSARPDDTRIQEALAEARRGAAEEVAARAAQENAAQEAGEAREQAAQEAGETASEPTRDLLGD